MANIGTLAVTVQARTGQFQKQMRSSRSLVGGLSKDMSGSLRTIARYGAALAAVAAGGAAGALVKRQFDLIDSTAKTADKLGITTEALTRLRFAAGQTGISAGTLDTTLQRMVRRIAEAAMGTGAAKNALAELGLNAQMLAQLSPDRQFGLIADRMGEVATQGDKVRLAMQIFDTEGVALVNTTKLGSAGLAAMAADADRLGVTLSRVDAARVEAANDAMARMRAATGAVFQNIAIELAPAIELVANSTANWFADTRAGASGVSSVFATMATGLGIVGDVANTVHLGFVKVQETFLGILSVMTEGITRFVVFVIDQLDRIPGFDLQGISGGVSQFGGELSDSLSQESKRLGAKFDKIFIAATPSEKIKKFLQQVEKDSLASVERTKTGATQIVASSVIQAAAIPKLLSSPIAPNSPDLPAAGQRAPLKALEFGTTEAFREARANMPGGKGNATDKKIEGHLARMRELMESDTKSPGIRLDVGNLA